MWWWSTRSTGSPARWPTSPSWSNLRCPGGLVRLGDPVLQHHDQHGEAHPQHAVVLRPVEREVTGERIRDKIAASKHRGIWVGGIRSATKVRERKLLIREDEAQIILLI